MIDLAVPIRTALIGQSGIMTNIASYLNSKAVFTQRPAPADAAYNMIMVSPDITSTNEDGVSDKRPMQTRDIAVYGLNTPDTNYAAVEAAGYAIKQFFHRNKNAIIVPGWGITQITATGPIPGPTDDEKVIARVVSVTFHFNAR